jgi:DNA-binding beta-propeller fold protein YncE
MKKAQFTLSLTMLAMLLLFVQNASAKALTVRITISGGGLMRTIEVTDPQVLALSHAWGSQFIDGSRTAENHAPPGLRAYEVSLYSEIAENDVRKTCVLYYYPNTSPEAGLIYLPRTGVLWWLNAGTIIRKGQDGKWNYASPAWEALIKPLIARGEAVRDVASASEVKIDGWTKPQPGWLYVLDQRSESDRPGSRIWLLDPQTEKVMGSVRVGFDPDFALSPDGSRLYVASGEREAGELSVIDTSGGEVHHIPFPDRILYKPWYAGLPPFYSMTISTDGRALRILGPRVLSPEKIEAQVRTFDTRIGRFAPEAIQLGDCGFGGFVPSSTARQFDFLCPATNAVHFVRLNADYQEASKISMQLPWPKWCDPAEAFSLPGGSKLAIIRNDGAIFEVDTATQKLASTPVTGDCRERLVFPIQWPRSPDGANIYLGYGGAATNNMSTAQELRVFDTATWQQLRGFRASIPFWSAVISKDGKTIYALVPEGHGVLVIDAVTGREKRAISVGKTPALALIAP